MRKKDSIALADAVRLIEFSFLQDSHDDRESIEVAAAIANARSHLADFCAGQSPCFERERWLDYIDGKCAPNGGKRS